jgi:all-trans-retinol 13,14-reductase
MDARFDVVVIGAGLGGLAAAAALARKGMSVLVLERHVVPGGYATSFVRGRYEFEVSLHVLSDIGTPQRPGGLRNFLGDVGAWEDVELVRVPHFARAVFADAEVLLPMDPDGFEAAICRACPGSTRGVRRFLRRVMAVAREADGLSDAFAMPRYAFTSLAAVLERDVDDRRARALLCQAWSYVGMPPSECSFLFYAATLGSLLNHGGWYPKQRSQGLSMALVRAVQRNGGRIRLGCGARRITVRHGRVASVVDDEGCETTSPQERSNASTGTSWERAFSRCISASPETPRVSGSTATR